MPTTLTTLRSIALDQPATISVFERFNLDYCCGGNRSLAEACAQKGIDSGIVLAALGEAVKSVEPAALDFTQATPSELIRHIVSTHHAYVRGKLPRLLSLAERCSAKHGSQHPEVTQIDRQLRLLAEDLTSHLNKEEIILFPYIAALEENRKGLGPVPHACFATVESPIQAMINEHESAAAMLEEMRTATAGFTPPADACPTLAVLYHGIDEFERDLHRHVHLENNLLFPLAIAMEKEVLAAH